mmetsp:Transcript_7168/g.14078  ORF Transcript_7168/g.14078 Transcript_7168/m.14078 type:complete len:218 (-) Transcript_7168:20-673(-)
MYCRLQAASHNLYENASLHTITLLGALCLARLWQFFFHGVRWLDDLGDVVALLLSDLHVALVKVGVHAFRLAHDPQVRAARVPHHAVLVRLVQFHQLVWQLQWPERRGFHVPSRLRIARGVQFLGYGFLLPGQRIRVEAKVDGNAFVLLIPRVLFDWIVCSFLEVSRNHPDDVPIPHKLGDVEFFHHPQRRQLARRRSHGVALRAAVSVFGCRCQWL